VNAPRTNLLGVDPRMTRLTRVCRAVGVGIAVTTATLAMTQVANAAPAPPPNVPPALVVPAGNRFKPGYFWEHDLPPYRKQHQAVRQVFG